LRQKQIPRFFASLRMTHELAPRGTLRSVGNTAV
jgi:hypothetical protein